MKQKDKKKTRRWTERIKNVQMPDPDLLDDQKKRQNLRPLASVQKQISPIKKDWNW